MAQTTFNIDVLTVSQPTFTKTPKGGYNQIEVAFKKDGKVEGKKLIDFKFPEVYKLFQTFKGNERVQVTSEKQDGEKFWNWINANVLTGESQGSAGATASDPSVPNSNAGSQPASGTTRPTRARATERDYETRAERAAKQVYIARQSSLERALDLVIHNAADGQVAPEAVIEVAKTFEAYVQGPVGKFADMDDDIPF